MLSVLKISNTLDYLKIISEFQYKTDDERGVFLESLLKKSRIDYFLHKTYFKFRRIKNIIVNLNKSNEPDVIFSTHYDVIRSYYPGANDCASGIVVLLDLILKMKQKKWNKNFRFIFFDLEEPSILNPRGCLGSQAYIKKFQTNQLKSVYNLELVGIGDAYAIWPVFKNHEDLSSFKILINAMKDLDYYYETAGEPSLFYADDRSFRENGFYNVFTITSVPFKDKDVVRKFAFASVGDVLSGRIQIPEMFRYYHTKDDVVETIDTDSLQRTVNLLYRVAEYWEKM